MSVDRRSARRDVGPKRDLDAKAFARIERRVGFDLSTAARERILELVGEYRAVVYAVGIPLSAPGSRGAPSARPRSSEIMRTLRKIEKAAAAFVDAVGPHGAEQLPVDRMIGSRLRQGGHAHLAHIVDQVARLQLAAAAIAAELPADNGGSQSDPARDALICGLRDLFVELTGDERSVVYRSEIYSGPLLDFIDEVFRSLGEPYGNSLGKMINRAVSA